MSAYSYGRRGGSRPASSASALSSLSTSATKASSTRAGSGTGRRSGAAAQQQLRALPTSDVVFDDVYEATGYTKTVYIRNVGSKLLRLRITEPDCEDFTASINGKACEGTLWSLAPGMELPVLIELFYEGGGSLVDKLVVESEGAGAATLVVPINVAFPKADVVVVPGDVDFGRVSANGGVATQTVVLENMGLEAADFLLKRDPAVGSSGARVFSIKPQHGELGPRGSDTCRQTVQVKLNASKPAMHKCVMSLEINGFQEDHLRQALVVTADIVSQSMELLDATGIQPLKHVDLGCLYYGNQRSRTFVVHNNGLDSASFVALCPEWETRMRCDESLGPAADAVEPATACSFTLDPSEGTLAPGEKRVVTISFRPTLETDNSLPLDDPEPRRDYRCVVCVAEAGSKSNRATCSASGSAVPPKLTLSQVDFDFGDCGVGQVSEIDFTLGNEGPMPLPFTVVKSANFSCTPSSGVVLPDHVMALSLAFRPKQLGSLSTTLKLLAADGTVGVPLEVHGTCVRDDTAARRSKPFAMTAAASQKQPRGLDHSTGIHPHGFRFGKPPSVNPVQTFSQPDGSQQPGVHVTAAPKGTARRRSTKTYVPPPDPRLTLDSKDKARKQREAEKYTSFIREYAQTRRDQELGDSSHSSQSKSNAVVDMSKPSSNQRSSTKRRSSKRRGTGVATGAKQRQDTTVELTPQQLHSVELGVDAVNFGCVCVGSRNMATVTVANNLDQDIAISVASDAAELSGSLPLSQQVVAARATSECTVVCTIAENTDTMYHDVVRVVVNGRHTLSVMVDAEVVPPRLDLDTTTVSVAVGSTSMRRTPYASQVVTLYNPFAKDQHFAWSLPTDSDFAIHPATGVVAAQGTLCCEVRLVPSFATKQATAKLQVQGAPDLELLCKPKFAGAKVDFAKRRVLLGKLTKGVATTSFAELVNTGHSDGYFNISGLAMQPTEAEVTLEPTTGIVPAGASCRIAINMTPNSTGAFTGRLLANCRGAKPLPLQFSGQAVNANFKLSVPKLDFEVVPLGAVRREPIIITNASPSPLSVGLAFSDVADFTVIHPADPTTGEMERPATTATASLDQASTAAARKLAETTRAAGLLSSHAVALDTFDTGFKGESRRFVGSEKTRLATAIAELRQAMEHMVPPPTSPATTRSGTFFVSVPANGRCSLDVEYAPTQVTRHDFSVGVLINEEVEQELPLVATSIPAPVSAWPRRVAFGRCFVGQGPREQTVEVTWGGQEAACLNFSVEANRPGFGCNVLQMQAEPGETVAVTVTFSGDLGGDGPCRGVLSVSNAAKPDTALASVDLSALASPPTLCFSQQEVCLPVVSPGATARAVVYVRPDGYGRLSKLYGEVVNAPKGVAITITCPPIDGHDAEWIPVVVAAVCSTAISCEVSAVFLDQDNRPFTLPLIVQSDSSTLSLCESSSHCKWIAPLLPDNAAAAALARDAQTLSCWLSRFGTKGTMPIAVPHTMTAELGKFAFLCVKFLSGEAVPGAPLVHPTVAPKGSMQRLLGLLVSFLVTKGANIRHVALEHLVNPEEFDFWLRQHLHTLAKDTVAQQLVQMQLRLDPQVELDCYARVSQQAWTTVLLQLLRLFAMRRVNLEAFLGAHEGKNTDFKPFEGSDRSHSECVNEEESHLLGWLSHHADCTVENFTSALSDGRVLACVLQDYIPCLSSHFQTLFQPAALSVSDHRRHNALLVVEALRWFGIDFGVQAEDIVEPDACYMVLLTAFLFQTLPKYLVPEESTVVEGVLLRPAATSFPIANSSKAPAKYKVIIQGDAEFIAPPTITVPGKGTKQLAVEFVARTTSERAAVVYVVGDGNGVARNNVWVFSLRSEIAVAPGRTRSQYHGSTPCYTAHHFPLQVCNPHPSQGLFAIRVVDQSLTAPGSKAATAGAVQRPAFWCESQMVTLHSRETVALPMVFLPTRPGHFRAIVVLSSPDVGEWATVVSGEALLPEPFDTLHWDTPLSRVADMSPGGIKVALTNYPKQRALATIPGAVDGDHLRSTRTLPPALRTQDPVTLGVTLAGSTVFSGPDNITLQATPTGVTATKGSVEFAFLPVSFKPVSAGKYATDVVLTGPDDTRLYRIEAIIVDAEEESIGFCAHMQSYEEKPVPFQNSTNKAWDLTCKFSTSDGSPSAFFSPSPVTVNAGESLNLPIRFVPPMPGEFHATLKVRNMTTDVVQTFQLHGQALLPDPHEVVDLVTEAHVPMTYTFGIPNDDNWPVTYMVTSELECCSGPPTVTVPPSGLMPCQMTFAPAVSQELCGSVVFLSEDGLRCHRFLVNVDVCPPKPSKTLCASCPVWGTSTLELPIENTSDAPDTVLLSVIGSDEVSLSENQVTIDPNNKATVTLSFAPQLTRPVTAQVVLLSALHGESRVALDLEATELPAEEIDLGTCPLGRVCSRPVTVSNPSLTPILWHSYSSHPEFWIEPSELTLESGESADVELCYAASQDEQQSGEVTLSSMVTSRVLRVRGMGTAPEPFDPVTTQVLLGRSASVDVTLRNPRTTPAVFDLCLAQADSALQIVGGEGRLTMGAQECTTVSLLYRPTKLAKSTGLLVLQELVPADSDHGGVGGTDDGDTDDGDTVSQGVVLEVPLVGQPQVALPKDTAIKLECVARSSQVKRCRLPLIGCREAIGAIASVTVHADPDNQPTVATWLAATVAPDQDEKRHSQEILLDIEFSPSVPFFRTAELCILREAGGVWRVPVMAKATPAAVDDTIEVDVPGLNQPSSVGFRLFPAADPLVFSVSWENGSTSCFSCTPEHGTLSAEGTLLVVTANVPCYGRKYEAVLCVEAPGFLWRYRFVALSPL
eukprot:m.274053 g.274053  ORF g.274053 m.274053 type:complete len:2808 (-) comp19343_c0_seq6:91-8514(-)